MHRGLARTDHSERERRPNHPTPRCRLPTENAPDSRLTGTAASALTNHNHPTDNHTHHTAVHNPYPRVQRSPHATKPRTIHDQPSQGLDRPG